MIFYYESLSNVLNYLKVDPDKGLSKGEAYNRLLNNGENKLKKVKRKTNFQRFIEQFKDVMILILLAAAIISFFVSYYQNEGFFEPLLIVLIVTLNAVMGVVQENKAEKAIEELKSLSSPNARVVRDGRESIVEASNLVVGDVIILEAGDIIPADARIILASNLKTEESFLTGESVSSEKDSSSVVEKDAALADRNNMLYSGCSISYGRAKAVVTATGMDTEIGKIADLLSEERTEQTHLQKNLAVLGKYLGISALVACAIIFIIGIIYGLNIMDVFMTSVSLAVASIPEALPAIVTILLAIGVQRMVKHNAIIRKLPAVETLGSASIICSDKTGTLTQNRMTLVKAFSSEKGILEDINLNNSQEIKDVLFYGALCCDGKVLFENGREEHIGDPTETSIVFAAHKQGMRKEDIDQRHPRLAEIPFDSERKLMTTLHNIGGKHIVVVKGAFDILAKKCISGDIQAGKEFADKLSGQALRVIAVAYKEVENIPKILNPDTLEDNLTFMGLLGMIDPPRPEAKAAVEMCRKAGIKPIMITGDNILTASAIAKELGILLKEDEAITGSELEAMSEDQLIKRVKNISVYARVSPSDKIRIVRAWQHLGEVVAMTGDGVNDAPALKAADIGCAMGITGTDVAKSAADIVLTDDNFATIVEAVREGRGIYDNIKKVVAFLIGTNIGEVLTVLFAILVWRETPLLSIHLLWINMVTDSMPAVALGMEKIESDIMSRKPKSKGQGIFSGGLGFQVLAQGFLFAILALVGFVIGWKLTGDIVAGRTMAFFILAMSKIIHSFNMRSTKSLFTIGIFSNKSLCKAIALSLMLIVVVVFVPPITFAFQLTSLSLEMYLIAFLFSFISIPIFEISKKSGIIRSWS